jgi:hypothetical protein
MSLVAPWYDISTTNESPLRITPDTKNLVLSRALAAAGRLRSMSARNDEGSRIPDADTHEQLSSIG